MLTASNLPAGEFGIGINGPAQASIPVASGILCVSSPGRHLPPSQASPNGYSFVCLDLTALPRPSGGPKTIMAGDTWYFTFWHRDGNTANFTDGICITFN